MANMTMTSHQPLEIDDTIVITANEELDQYQLQAIDCHKLEHLLGTETSLEALENILPPAGYRRALIILSENEAYWSAIDAEGNLDSSMISADTDTLDTSVFNNANAHVSDAVVELATW